MSEDFTLGALFGILLEDNQKDVTDFELELALRDHIVLTTAHEDHELFFLEVQLHELIALLEHLARDGTLDHLCPVY